MAGGGGVAGDFATCAPFDQRNVELGQLNAVDGGISMV
jgi:hypothetical protein